MWICQFSCCVMLCFFISQNTEQFRIQMSVNDASFSLSLTISVGEGKKIPPPVSPKPVPPPTAPKPAKLIHSMTSPPSPTPAQAPAPVRQHSAVARQTSSPPTFPPSNIPSPPNAKPVSPSSQSPHTPQTPTTPQTPQTPATPSPTPPPVKPPRSSIGGVSVDSGMTGGGVTAPATTTTDFSVDSLVHQKLEETSASLAAALQAVEDKILRQEE